MLWLVALQTRQRRQDSRHRKIGYSQAHKLFLVVCDRAHDPQHSVLATRAALHRTLHRLPHRQDGAADDVHVPTSLDAHKPKQQREWIVLVR